MTTTTQRSQDRSGSHEASFVAGHGSISWREHLVDAVVTASAALALLGVMLRSLVGELDHPMGKLDVIGNAAGITMHWTVPELGFPFGMKFAPYFPTLELTQTGMAAALLKLTGNAFLAQNLVWALSFPITAVACLWVFKLLPTPRPLAIALALAATFIPYHVVRAFYHPWLSTMWPAVLGVGLCLLVGTGRSPRVRGVKLRSGDGARLAGTTLICVLVAYGGIYYAFFTVVLLAVTLTWRALNASHRGGLGPPLIRDAYPLGVVLLAVTMALFCTSLANSHDPPTRPVAARAPVDSGYFAGNLTFGLSPSPVTWVPVARQVTQPLGHAVNSEIEGSTYGQFGSVAGTLALGVLAIGLAIRRRRRIRDGSPSGAPTAPSSLLLTLLVAATALFVPEAAGYAFASYVTPAIRSWDRLLPMLLTIVLAAAVALISELAPHPRRWAVQVAAAVLVLLTLFDGVLPYHALISRQLFKGAAATATGEAYAAAVNHVDKAKCGVLELPFMPFPESPPTGHLPDYSHFVAAMTNPDKLWSYGGVKYTSAGLWQMRLGNDVTPSAVTALREVGFCGVHLDLRGLDRADVAPTIDALTTLLGPPAATGHGGDWLYFRIRGGAANVGAIDDPARLSESTRNFFFSREIVAP